MPTFILFRIKKQKKWSVKVLKEKFLDQFNLQPSTVEIYDYDKNKKESLQSANSSEKYK